MTPGETKEFDVRYPEDYGQPKLAGKTIRFHATLKGIRHKELPELNDEFARDLGDYQNLEELREAVRKSLFSERQYFAQQEAKGKIVDALVERHEFPVPEAFIERQIQAEVERNLRMLAAEGVDPRSIKLDWEKVKASQRDKAVHDVKASLLLENICRGRADLRDAGRGGPRGAASRTPGARAGGGDPQAAGEGRRNPPHRQPHPHREDAELSVRARAQRSRGGLEGPHRTACGLWRVDPVSAMAARHPDEC